MSLLRTHTIGALILLVAISTIANDKFFGCIWKSAWTSDSLVPPSFTELFDQTTPENAGKWGKAEPTRDSYEWAVLDTMASFARARGIPVKQHTFVWGQQQPDWTNSFTDSADAKSAVRSWMSAYALRYADVTTMVDVVNEPLHAAPAYKDFLGGNGTTGWDWVVWTFETARQALPNAALILNDYDILKSEHNTNNLKAIIAILQQRELIDGIGVQGHFLEGTSAATVKANLDRLAQTGLPIYVSELDLNISDDTQQLDKYKELFPVMWEHASVAGITLWGYQEGKMWRDQGFLLRADGTDRPALTWLKTYLGKNPVSARPSAAVLRPQALSTAKTNHTIHIDKKLFGVGTIRPNGQVLPHALLPTHRSR